MTREILLVDRNRPLYFIRFFMLFLLALVTATLFVRTRMAPNSIADGALYFGGNRMQFLNAGLILHYSSKCQHVGLTDEA